MTYTPTPYDGILNPTACAPIVFSGMSNEDYHAALGLSKSALDKIARSPAHYAFGAPRKPSRAMEIGTAIHTAILEPERFASEYQLLRDVHDRRSSVYKEAVKVHGSERVLVGHEADKVAGMQESVRSHRAAAGLLVGGRAELSAFAQNPSGVLIKARPDYVTQGGEMLVDVKKTRDASRGAFQRAIHDYRYHVQVAWYLDVWRRVTGIDAEFRIVAVEEEPPHNVVVYALDPEAVERGETLAEADLARYVECVERQEWPGYSDEVETITLPPWGWGEDEDVEIMTEDDNDA